MWDNLIFWCEICIWVYGCKIIFIWFVYLLLFVMVVVGLYWLVIFLVDLLDLLSIVILLVFRFLILFFLVSLVIVNVLLVILIIVEWDGCALDLLFVIDLIFKELLFGKMGGIFWVVKDMVIVFMVFCVVVWWMGEILLE